MKVSNEIHRVVFQFILLLLATTVACSENNNQADARLAALEETVTANGRRIDSLATPVRDMSSKVAVMWDAVLEREFVELTPSDEGFSVLDSEYGLLTFKILNVQPYADGSRVTLRVGNLTAATISGGEYEAIWGATEPDWETASQSVRDWAVQHNQWEASLQTDGRSFRKDLEPGFWNSITLTLPGTPPDELGYLKINRLNLSSISLSVP